MAQPSEVALYGYRAMQTGKTVAIPGFINKFLASLHRVVSRSMAAKIVRTSRKE
jgi:short-subunit dehydrogenase